MEQLDSIQLAEKLEKSSEVEFESIPKVEHLQMMLDLEDAKKREFGVVFVSGPDKNSVVYSQSPKDTPISIGIPANDLNGKKVFFHTHPIEEFLGEVPADHPTWFLPSFDKRSGDIFNTFFLGDNKRGGYMNIATTNGYCLFVGAEEIGETVEGGISAQILTGECAGEEFPDRDTFDPLGKKFLDETGVALVAISDNDEHAKYYMLCINRENLDNGDFDFNEILFGDGLLKLYEKYHLPLPEGAQARNLYEVLNIDPGGTYFKKSLQNREFTSDSGGDFYGD